MVDQPGRGKNTSYLVDFIPNSYQSKLPKLEEIRRLFVDRGLSAAQIATEHGVSKSSVIETLNRNGVHIGRIGRMTNPKNYRCRVAPFGYRVHRSQLVVDKAEFKICRLVVNLVGRKRLSLTATAKELGIRGFKNRAGQKKWDHKTVQSIFKRWSGKI